MASLPSAFNNIVFKGSFSASGTDTFNNVSIPITASGSLTITLTKSVSGNFSGTWFASGTEFGAGQSLGFSYGGTLSDGGNGGFILVSTDGEGFFINTPAVVSDGGHIELSSPWSYPDGSGTVTAGLDAAFNPNAPLILTGTDGADTLVGGVGNDVLDGGAGDDSLSGGAGSDVLRGGTGNDILDGGTGADRMVGGSGKDTYYVDNIGDLVIETDNEPEGTSGLRVKLDLGSAVDKVISSISYALTNYVENLTLNADSGKINGNGNALDNLLEGNSSDNRLNGGLGDDTLSGGLGDDTLIGGDVAGTVGIDLVILDGKRADYVISRTTESSILNSVVKVSRTVAGVTETDTLVGIERIRYADSQNDSALTQDDLLKNTASIFADKYEGTAQDDTFDGLAGNDSIVGGGGNDSLTGGLGNDTLDGGTGSDRLIGGLGNDIYVVDTAAVADADPAKAVAGDLVVEDGNAGNDKVQTSLTSYALTANVEQLEYLGTPVAVLDTAGKPTGATEVKQLAFVGTGNDLANTLTGGSGNDSLDGGKGADRMIGGAGDDTYVVDRIGSISIGADGSVIAIPGDQVIEKTTAGADSGGNDTIQTALGSYSLASIANVENLSYTGSGKFVGLGNDVANLLAGNVGADTLDGGKGDDTLVGGGGNDLLKGGDGIDTAQLAGNRTDYVFSRPDVGKVQVARKDGSETDLLTGVEKVKFGDGTPGDLTLDDLLKNTASKLDDSYEGDAEVNVFDGLAGNDSILGGGGNDNLTGGAGNDTLNGGSGDDSLIGGIGNDSYVIDSLADVVVENAGEGLDTERTSLASLTLAANVEVLVYEGTGNFSGTGNELANTLSGGVGKDSLVGGAGNDLLQGGGGDDRLDGGEGIDRLEGGAGDDTYLLAGPGDQVREIDAAGNDTGGTDTVRAQAAGRYLLALNVENFVADTAEGVGATGNAGNNQLTGNAGNDTLTGAAGNDTLDGGAGSDRLTGGLDSDVFVFSNAPASGVDTLGDFKSGEDKIQLDHLIFDTLGAAGALNTEFFVEGKVALDANDYLVYDKATGALWYDADGSAAGAATQIAQLSIKAALVAADFLVG